MNTSGMMTSKTNEWYTPDKIFNDLDNEFNFDLDPCATNESAKCLLYYTQEDDGLSKSWVGHNVFMNPPYGREIKDWIKKAYEESLKENTTVVALIPARTDTRYWHDYIFGKATQIRFVKGRIGFVNEEGIETSGCTFPSAIIVWSKSIKPEELNQRYNYVK